MLPAMTSTSMALLKACNLMPSCSAYAMLRPARHFAVGSNHTALIKQLRERTGSPISDVKNCLEAAGWDVEAAYEALRKKGLAAAAKKSHRHAAEGLVGCAVAEGSRSAVIVEVNSETDFVARSQAFQDMVYQVSAAALLVPPHHGSHVECMPGVSELRITEVSNAVLASGHTASEAVAAVAAQVRENVRLRRAFRCDTTTGCVSAYVHQPPAPGLGRIASLVLLEPEEKALEHDQLAHVEEVGRQLAMHVAGMRPQYLTKALVPPSVLDKERSILREQVTDKKPEAVINKIIDGRLNKFYEDIVLTEQKFVLDDSVKVSKVLDALSRKVGQKMELASFLRVQVGEGLEAVEKKDFAAEVMEMAKS